MLFDRPIVIGLSPNLESEDILSAVKILFQPWKWKTGKNISLVEQWFKDYFQVDTAVTFNAGRSALLAVLKSLNLPEDSEVMCQAFTCVAVPNSIIWAGLKPIYIDIDKSLNLDVTDAQKKITPKTKVLIVQHTFGIPANMDKITAFCRKHKLFLIEDCAHALGTTYKGRKIGTYADAAIFSFGRDKVVSAIFGGVTIVNGKRKAISDKLLTYHKYINYPSTYWIFQQLMHPILMMVILPLYNFLNIGKGILYLAQKLKLLSFPVYQEEKQNFQPQDFPKRLPNALAQLALVQLGKLIKFNQRRRQIAEKYFSKLKNTDFQLPQKVGGAIYIRFNLLAEKADEIRFKARKKGIILGNWYQNLIDPKGVDLEKTKYIFGSCPKAEQTAQNCLNLPTYPLLTEQEIDYICQEIIKNK